MESFPFKKLVVGCDLEGRSNEALRVALGFAKRNSARIELIHGVNIPPPECVAGDPVNVASMNAEIMNRTWQHLEQKTRAIFDELEFKCSSMEDVLTVGPGPHGRLLLDRARDIDADVIFLGPHNPTGMFDFGGTARAVLAHAPGGVWVQPGPCTPIRRILAPIDLSPQSMASLAVAKVLAKDMGASLTVLHAFEPPDFAYAPDISGYPVGGPAYNESEVQEGARRAFLSAMDAVDWNGIQHESIFQSGKPTPLILNQSKDHDLIVLGSHGRTGLSAVVLGNVAYGVLKSSKTPVLALRDPAREWLV
ncbi:MAG: nucleotide-binding universal stress UspA family protein [Planctomycetota bacterium]|jgi:nucleotide-binding universal stress UspA family protein